ncbi:hypothetical protein K7887_22115 (plasmid) [Sutcliffiella horikoshii]|uniref:hypothetical protein n=1 Tax=Sutcliffiella horikoshii TaxID=79883 RepID=UPI001CC1800F|nr:hypothetical protein [Sutcliffiella horikoshii]UAL49817.1 hypothetical protein K7887_22115 [Sutcliffiella horikoshii]
MGAKERTGFTKLGFAKGFSCCGHFTECNMGKSDCYWEEQDPEAKEYCTCYQRNQQKKSSDKIVETLNIPESITSKPVEDESPVLDKTKVNEESQLVQLSLF